MVAMGAPDGQQTRSPRIGIAVRRSDSPQGTNPFYEALLAGMEERLDEHGASVVLSLFDSAEEELAAYPRWAEQGDLDAVVLVDLAEGDQRLEQCRSVGLPVAVLGLPYAEGASLVDVDNSEAMTMAVDFLVGEGHRDIARVSGPAWLTHTAARTTAFDEAIARAGCTGRTVEGDYSPESGAAATRQLLADPAQRPTAVVFDNDLMAVAALQVAQDLGLSVPHDVSLLAWDDSPPCRLSDPPLSVVSRDVHELGETLASVVLDTYRGKLQRVVHAASAQIVVRGSTAPPLREPTRAG